MDKLAIIFGARVTGSFLRESVLAFRDYFRAKCPGASILLANLNDVVLEELAAVLSHKGDALVVCVTSETGALMSPRIIGRLEPMQALTLQAIMEVGEADAQTLAKQGTGPEKIGITGWHNRLASLAAKGILVEQREGRTKRYRPVLQGLLYGD